MSDGSGGQCWAEAALGKERAGDTGTIGGLFDLQQVAGVGHHFVSVAKPGVHLAVDLAER